MDEGALQPLFATIVVPAKNASTTIAATLRSLQNQTSERFEVVVVDDGSTDGTGAMVRALNDSRFRLISCEGAGQSDALNTGIRYARGTVFMRCDADDLYEPGRVEWQLTYLRDHPAVDAVCGTVSAIRSDGAFLAPLRSRILSGSNISSDLAAGIVHSHLGAYAVRVRAIHRAGGFRTFFRFNQDFDFLFRLGETSAVVFVDQPAYVIRFSDTSVCRTTPVALRRWYVAKAEEFRRERQVTGADALSRGEAPAPPSTFDEERQPATTAIRDILCGAAWGNLADGRWGAAMRYAARALREAPCSRSTWRCASIIMLKGIFLKLR